MNSTAAYRRQNREALQEHSLREMLVDSNVAAVAIAVLVLWSLISAVQALWGPFARLAEYILTAVAILDFPYMSRTLTLSDVLLIFTTLSHLISAFISYAAAWLLSFWIYRSGPVRTLSSYRTRLARRHHV